MKKSMLKKLVMMTLAMGAMYIPGMASAEEAAAPQEFALDEVVVTASMIEQNKFDAHANMSVVTSQEIEKMHYTDTVEVIRNVPGVSLNDYGDPGHDASSGLRINGSKQVVVLVDGVRITATNIGSFQAIKSVPVENIERVEVMKGAGSALYGADAVGGVVNIITKKADGNKTIVGVSGGSFKTEEYKVYNQGKQEKFSWRVNAKKNHLGNYNDGKDEKHERTLNAETVGIMVRQEFKEGTDLALSYDNYNGDFTYYDISGYNGNVKGKNKNSSFTISSNQKFNDNTTNKITVKRNTYDYKFDTVSGGIWPSPYHNVVKGWSINDTLAKKLSERHTIVAGVEYNNDHVDYKSANLKNAIVNKAFVLQEQWQMSDKWDMTSGVRFDDHSSAGNAITPRFNVGYKADDNNSVYVGYSRFFVAPGYYDYYDATYGNKDLNPEKGYNWEFGWNHKFDESSDVSINMFNRRKSNAFGMDPYTWKTVNMDKENAKGFDVQYSKKIEHIGVKAGYIYTLAKVENDGNVNYNVSGFVPRHTINLGLDYNNRKFDAGINVKGALKRGAFEGQFPSENYWVVDLGMNYKAVKNGKVFLKVNNLFDKYYAENTVRTSPGVPGPYYAAPGRSIIAGMEYSF